MAALAAERSTPYIPATDRARARKCYEEKVGLVAREEIAGGVVYEVTKGIRTTAGARPAPCP